MNLTWNNSNPILHGGGVGGGGGGVKTATIELNFK